MNVLPFKEGLRIYPKKIKDKHIDAYELSYIENILGLKKEGDVIKIKRVNDESGELLYLETTLIDDIAYIKCENCNHINKLKE